MRYDSMRRREPDHATEIIRECGTTACVAGWGALLVDSLGVLQVHRDVAERNRYLVDLGFLVENKARRALGLGIHDAGWLFDSERTRDEVVAALRSIAETGIFKIQEDEE